jgi:hypothetical protein
VPVVYEVEDGEDQIRDQDEKRNNVKLRIEPSVVL